MLFLLDTNAFSDLVQGHPRLKDRVAALSAQDRLIICSIVWGEIAYGIERMPEGKRRTDLAAKADRILASLDCEPVPPQAGNYYAAAKLARQRGGLAMDENDLWIASTAMALDATLVSRDADFHRIAGLNLEDWTL